MSTHRITGTLRWQAPELLIGADVNSRTTFATDVYAFAMVCYEVSRFVFCLRDIISSCSRCLLGHTLFMTLQMILGSCLPYKRAKGRSHHYTIWAGYAVGATRYCISLKHAGLISPRNECLLATLWRHCVHCLTDQWIKGHWTHSTLLLHLRFQRVIPSLCLSPKAKGVGQLVVVYLGSPFTIIRCKIVTNFNLVCELLLVVPIGCELPFTLFL